jgi:hypothetical protein
MSFQLSSPSGAGQLFADESERRTTPRFPCLRQCLVWLETVEGAGEWSGMLYNISTHGLGLALPCPVAQGTVLVVEPLGRDRAWRLRARVTRSALTAFVWFHGCELVEPLSQDELERWIKTTGSARSARRRPNPNHLVVPAEEQAG